MGGEADHISKAGALRDYILFNTQANFHFLHQHIERESLLSLCNNIGIILLRIGVSPW